MAAAMECGLLLELEHMNRALGSLGRGREEEALMPRFAQFVHVVYRCVLERFSVLQPGFQGGGYLFPYSGRQRLAQRLQANGLTRYCSTSAGGLAGGKRGACLRIALKIRAGVEQGIAMGVLGNTRLNAAGLKPAGFQTEAGHAGPNDSMRRTTLPRRGDTVLEAINSRVDMPGFLLDTTGKVMELIEAVDADNVRLQYDIYHMQVMEGDLVRSMECLLPWIAHIQFADNPGRNEPGTGEINFSNVFAALDRMGYAGWVSAEYRPSAVTEASLGWFRPGC